MTEDFVSEARSLQAIISKDIADLLISEYPEEVDLKYDPLSYAEMKFSDLFGKVYVSIIVYTDWLIFKKLLRETGWGVQPLPTEVPYEEISGQYNISSEILEKTVNLLHERFTIPLVGFVKDGKLYPNKHMIASYVSLFAKPKMVENYNALFE